MMYFYHTRQQIISANGGTSSPMKCLKRSVETIFSQTSTAPKWLSAATLALSNPFNAHSWLWKMKIQKKGFLQSILKLCLIFPQAADMSILSLLSLFLCFQCSSWLLACWSTPLALTLHWSGLSAEKPTSTTLASARSVGATCWPSLESCSLSSCPFLPNMHPRSSCPPPLYPHCYSELMGFCFSSWPLSL